MRVSRFEWTPGQIPTPKRALTARFDSCKHCPRLTTGLTTQIRNLRFQRQPLGR